MLVWNGLITTDSLPPTAFRVGLHDENENAYTAEVVETAIRVNYIFLKLRDEIPPGSTPFVRTSTEYEIEFFLGDRFYRWDIPGVQINDGIPPTLTMSLSGGTGTGTGDEGPGRLTKDKIDITVSSDEPLAEPPSITVVCNDIQWTETDDSTLINNIDYFIFNRAGQLTESQSTNPDSLNDQASDYWCGDDDDFTLTKTSMTATGETSWTYEWRNPENSPHKLSDGLLTAVAHARDQSEYQNHDHGETIHNWSAASQNFTLDSVLKSPLGFGPLGVEPENGSTTYIDRPLVWIEFHDLRHVTLNSIKFDGVEVIGEIHEVVEDNKFVYWPLEIKSGEHRVAIEATDTAGNSVAFDFGFTRSYLDPFIIRLKTGWNAISVPSDPVDGRIDAVFDNSAVRMVATWVESKLSGPWSVSVRRQGSWRALADFDPVRSVRSEDGYWVYATADAQLTVPLRPVRPWMPGRPVTLELDFCEWCFVGVVDLHGVQIEDHFGEYLKDSRGTRVTAREYLSSRYDIAFRWNAQTQSYETLQTADGLKLGEAIWVHYADLILP